MTGVPFDYTGGVLQPEGTVLCRSCWQASIIEERKTKVSRLVNYRRRHPVRPTKQCNGRTWW